MLGLNMVYLYKSLLNVAGSDMLSISQAQLDNSVRSGHYILCSQMCMRSLVLCSRTSGNTISCLFALLMQENESRIWCLWLTEKGQDSDQYCTHSSGNRNTSDPLTTFDCSFFSPPLPSFAHPSFTDTRCILSLSTHASLAHTPLPLLLRGRTAVSEQALPLCGADRAGAD